MHANACLYTHAYIHVYTHVHTHVYTLDVVRPSTLVAGVTLFFLATFRGMPTANAEG